MGYIAAADLDALAAGLGRNPYAQYLRSVLRETP